VAVAVVVAMILITVVVVVVPEDYFNQFLNMVLVL
jgi:hypothetical protein